MVVIVDNKLKKAATEKHSNAFAESSGGNSDLIKFLQP